MPARRSKQTAQKSAKVTVTKKGSKVTSTTRKEPKVATTSTGRRREGRGQGVKVKATWKPVSQSTKDFVLRTFDAGVGLVTHKVPRDKHTQVQDSFVSARNEIAASLETLWVPPSKHSYSHLSTTLVGLKELKQQLEQRHSTLTDMLDNQHRELQKLQDEKTYLQDFGKTPKKHHPLLMEQQEKELHLNFDTVK